MFKRILVPLDGSRTADRGLDTAIGLAKSQRATLCLLHVLDEHMFIQYAEAGATAAVTSEFLESLRRNGRKILDRAALRASKQRVPSKSVLVDSLMRGVADVIIAQAKKFRADLIVMGTHGSRGLTRLVLGSESESVVHNTPVPVLLVRGARKRR